MRGVFERCNDFMTTPNYKRIIEALILCHDAPMTLAQIKATLESDLDNAALRELLDEIKLDWSERAVNLMQLASGWRFQSAPDMLPFLDRLRAEKPAQYSRAVMETLAIIAYRQPVTRGDIEDIRGVTVSSEIIKKLEERGWIDVVGHRETVGRPSLFATTKQFLDDLGFVGLHELPILTAPETPGDIESAQLSLLEMPAVAQADTVSGDVLSDDELLLIDTAEEALINEESVLKELAELDDVSSPIAAESTPDVTEAIALPTALADAANDGENDVTTPTDDLNGQI